MLQHTKLADIQTIPATPGNLYSNLAGSKTFVREIVLHNTGTTTETVKFYNVPDASGTLGVPGNGNRFANFSIPANDTVFVSFEYPVILSDTSDAIFGETTTANRVTVMLLGDREV